MANENQFTAKAVDAAQEVLSELKTKAKQAHDSNDVFMMGVMTELIGVASPIVNKAVARLNREERSRINKAHKELRVKNRTMPTGDRPHLQRPTTNLSDK